MAVSCSEVMYGAYYPYLYGRGAARSFHHAPHFQYDRLNVQSGAANAGSEAYGAAALSSGSASSGAQSPGSPPHAHLPHHARLRAKEEDLSAHGRASADGGGSSESETECGAGAARARAQYVSANCVVFTHYSGDVAAVVDEHFARALSLDKPKESVPMVSRNLPASFFNAAAAAGVGAGGACGGVDIYEYDPWHQHYGGYGHAAHRHAAEYHAAAAHHNMAAAAGYGGLLLGRGPLHAQYKPVEWGAQHAPHHLDPAACSPYSYPAVPGLEAQVQDTSKDLYWF
ncbi:protein vestigial [Helicoverpa armigera]|uniref:protein vestigial n=1 Tax=Helicoverpa zea TaxID=7113 RepID=UPI000B399D29|nr:protein vestigial [Helicoverpa zea]